MEHFQHGTIQGDPVVFLRLDRSTEFPILSYILLKPLLEQKTFCFILFCFLIAEFVHIMGLFQ